ncbi:MULTISPECIES: 6-phosphogluconolactonase [Pseudomonas syringae group]|uniref:6-phosphogluconolactonase n=1 Tax=Pseudomonas syringae group TaxID=136849 RepID=UPI000BB5E565|nr:MULTISPECIES: 6-phosphogluconolactonase [Pseudomonas syringae group]MDU8418894.1 6-phosphogluconolactonase [Pseudomonas syringae]MCK9690336.1 6-phosphogluconolactonase [Pseudomonas syringae pv. syringae]MCK9746047.1 6-phosphogluconolactonase [Pseudomonas syringae pv. syringae]MCK9751869.1 6-phosphogluconolactonase [Pseudomonas syringae pv. syringae]MCZ0946293.1 6-phosphogluconolactonase [Pseudomonas syringae pv. tomato]
MATCDLKLPAGLVAHDFDTAQQLADALAQTVAERLKQAISENGLATLVVSGGRSPVAFFQRLAAQPLEWSKVVISLADERFVPTEHADSNAGLLHRHLLQGPVAKAKFLGLYSVASSVEEAAQAADQALAELPPIDVLILGMGDDGHTASLFPNSPNLSEALDLQGERRCLPMLAPSVPHQRLTLTRRLLASARSPILSVSGQAKLDTLRTALAGDDLAEMPVRAFLNPSLEIYWCP